MKLDLIYKRLNKGFTIKGLNRMDTVDIHITVPLEFDLLDELAHVLSRGMNNRDYETKTNNY